MYDAFADFSATQNPDGVWTYGWSTNLAGPLTVYTGTFEKEGGYNWTDFSIIASGDPNVAYVPVDDTGADVPAGTVAFHPGPGNQFSHCLFTAPTAGVYTVQASFTALSYGGPHVYILHNGVSIGDSLLTQGTPWAASFSSVTLAAGDTIDAVTGVGTDGVYYNDEATFSLTITSVAGGTQAGSFVPGLHTGLLTGTSGPGGAGGGSTAHGRRSGAFTAVTNVTGDTQTGLFVPGLYTGLLSGSSGPGGVGGVFTAHIQKIGAFTALLNIGGERVPFKGTFSVSGLYSTVLKLKDGMQLTVSLSFDANGNLTGTVSDNDETFSLSADEASNIVSAGGIYPFTVSPIPSSGSGNVPKGTGFGYMYVRAGGAVSIVGQLGDGTSFSTSSTITSGSAVPVYANLYKSAAGGIAGTLVFQDVPDVSDCAGTLYWNRPATESSAPYSQGFESSTQFLADQFDPSIGRLNHDDAALVASGADLQADFLANVTLQYHGGEIPLFGGNAANLQLSITPVGDAFFGSFEDGATHTMHSFAGVLLPKSRTGAGIFFSGGLSGSVNIEY